MTGKNKSKGKIKKKDNVSENSSDMEDDENEIRR